MAAGQPNVFSIQEFNDLGGPMVGGRLYTYVPGTTTFQVTYTDAAGTIPQTYTNDGMGGQYIALNARGELAAQLYLSAPTDINLRRADNSNVWTRTATSSLLALIVSGGAALVGYIANFIGAVARTVADKLNDNLSAKDAGAPTDGTTDASDPLIAIIASGRSFDLGGPENVYLVTKSLGQLGFAQRMTGQGATIKTNANAKIIQQNDYSVIDGVQFQGSGKDSGLLSQVAISIDGDGSFNGPTRSRTINCNFTDMGGSGFHVGNVVLNHQGNQLSGAIYKSCNVGLDVGTRGEYMQIEGGCATLCNVGVSVAGGNTNLGSMMLNDNTVGIDLVNGGAASNDAHGQVYGFTANHNTHNIRANPTVVPSFAFRNGQCYEGDILFNGCVGVELQGISFGTVTFTENTGTRQTYVRGCSYLDSPVITPNVGGPSEVFYLDSILPSSLGPSSLLRINGAYSEVNQTVQPVITAGTLADYIFDTVTINAIAGNAAYAVFQLYDTTAGCWDFASASAPKTPNHDFFATVAVNLSIGVTGGSFDATNVDVYLVDQTAGTRLATLTASVPLLTGSTNYRVYSFMGRVPLGEGKIGIKIKNGSSGSIVVLNDATLTPTHGYATGW